MTNYSFQPSMNDNRSFAGETFPAAAIVCAIGFFLRILLSAPVLNILGINYGGDEGGFLSKIHPGSTLILISFLILIFSYRNPLDQIIRIARQHTAFFSLFAIYVLVMAYWILRGPKGVGLILDVHIVMPICAIVFSYAPKSYCRAIVYAFVSLAALNSVIGIVESTTHGRLFPFDPDWEVLHQDYFRASAFLGHPLTNAAFTTVSIFVLLSLRISNLLKGSLFLVMLLSLVAFGGRSALGFSIMGLIILGAIEIRRYFMTHTLNVLRLLVILLALMLIPIACISLLYAVLHSGMGERLLAYSSLNDESAEVRLWSLRVFNFMSPADILLGVDGDQITTITSYAGVSAPTTDIENPWILMLLFLGAVLFPVWLMGLGACVWRLMAGAAPALKIAVIIYFLIASMSNSFGRKDPMYAILAGIIVCTKRLNEVEEPAPPRIHNHA